MPIQFAVSKKELDTAYQRIKNDRPKRCFVEYPNIFNFIDVDKNILFDELTEKISLGYQPHPTQMCWVPKTNHQVRPANILHIKDEIVFNLIIGAIFPTLYGHNQRFKEVDIAYPLSTPEKTKWISNQFNAWKHFSTKSIEILNKEYAFVVYSDITGFYENINIKRMILTLKELCGDMPQIDLLSSCLNVWSNRGEDGIPQGYSGSDILSKTFANKLDEMLINGGFKHLRYVDDLRIFCKSKEEAKRAILSLSKYVHTLGLNLQSAKTKILFKKDAIEESHGTTQLIESIRSNLVEDFAFEILNYSEYPNQEEATEKALEEYPPDSIDVFERVFFENFTDITSVEFNKSLFHFLINRLGKFKSKIAVTYCLETLIEKPEETNEILEYLKSAEIEVNEVSALIALLTSDENVYDYQRYQVLKWFFDNDINNQEIVKYSRTTMEDANKYPWLRAFAIVYLGKFGNEADLANLEYQFTQEASPIIKAHCIEACRRRTPIIRNAFYNRISGQDNLFRLAISYSRRG